MRSPFIFEVEEFEREDEFEFEEEIDWENGLPTNGWVPPEDVRRVGESQSIRYHCCPN